MNIVLKEGMTIELDNMRKAKIVKENGRKLVRHSNGFVELERLVKSQNAIGVGVVYSLHCFITKVWDEDNKLIWEFPVFYELDNSKLVRYRFHLSDKIDPLPIVDMKSIQMPWWITGHGDGYITIVCYLPNGENLLNYWDKACDIDSEEKDSIVYTDRFPKPKWIKD